MIKELAKLATRLDKLGLTKEADVLDSALNKMAQAQVATEGLEGAKYQGGRVISPPVRGGARVKFYVAKPTSLSQFNKYLGGLIADFAKIPGQTVFSKPVISNPPTEAMTGWTKQTQDAFVEYAKAVGKPGAANWKAFTSDPKSKYAPSLSGIYAFWDDTIRDLEGEALLQASLKSLTPADTAAAKGVEEKREGKGVVMPGGPGPGYDPLHPLADLSFLTPEQRGLTPAATTAPSAATPEAERKNLLGLSGRLFDLTAGTHIQIGAKDAPFFSTFQGQIMKRIKQAMAASPAAKAWFLQDPKKVLPNDAVRSGNFRGVYTGSDTEIKAVYDMIQELENYKASLPPSK